MKRSTWIAVLVTASVLVLAGNLPRLPLVSLASALRAGFAHSAAAWPRLSPRALAATRTGAPARAPLAAAPRPTRHAYVPVAPPRLLATTPARAGSRSAFDPRPWFALPLQVALPAAAGALAGLLALGALLATHRRDRRDHVWQLARRGLTAARIARSAHVPQDAVRTLLTPGLGARR